MSHKRDGGRTCSACRRFPSVYAKGGYCRDCMKLYMRRRRKKLNNPNWWLDGKEGENAGQGTGIIVIE